MPFHERARGTVTSALEVARASALSIESIVHGDALPNEWVSRDKRTATYYSAELQEKSEGRSRACFLCTQMFASCTFVRLVCGFGRLVCQWRAYESVRMTTDCRSSSYCRVRLDGGGSFVARPRRFPPQWREGGDLNHHGVTR